MSLDPVSSLSRSHRTCAGISGMETGIEHLDRFTETLLARGYRPSTIAERRSRCQHFIVWLRLSGIPITAVDEKVRNRFLNHDCRCVRKIFSGSLALTRPPEAVGI